MSEVGALIIKLQAETAQFRSEMGKVKGDLAGLKGEAGITDKAFNMREARGSMMLLGEETGVRIPRHLQALIAQIPGVGVAFAAMLPLVGVAAAIGIIVKLIEHHEKLAEAIRKATIENQNIALSEDNVTRSMEVANLKLEDQIAKLEGRPGTNKLKEEMLETQSEVVKLAGSFDVQFQKIDGAIRTGTSTLGTYWQELKNIASMPVFLARNAGAQAVELVDAIDKVTEAEDHAREDLAKLNSASGLDNIKAATKDYVNDLRNVQNYTRLALVAAQDQASQNPEQISALKQQIRSLTTEIKDYALQDEKAQLQVRLDVATTAKAISDAKEKTYEEGVADIERGLNEELRGLDRSQAMNEEVQREIEAGVKKEIEDRKQLIAEEQAAAEGTLGMAIEDARGKEKLVMQSAKNLEALHKQSAAQTTATEIAASQTETNAEVKAYQDRIKALDKFSTDYLKKVQDLEKKIGEVTKKGEYDVAQINQAALQKQTLDTQHAYDSMYHAIASDISKSIVMNQSLVLSFRQTGEQLLEGMIKNLIIMELTHDKEKLINAKGAFDKSFNWASAWGGPIAGAIAGAASFAAVMAFEQGGKIPGQGAVPILGHGGETVVTRALTDRVEQAEGKSSPTRGDFHLHSNFAPQIHAVDAEGVERMLTKHATLFQRTVASTMRRLNK